MTNSAKNKGDRGEREVQELLRVLLEDPTIRRALGAGRKDDVGDMDNILDTVIQVADWKDLLAAIREKLPSVEIQRKNANAKYGALFLRKRGGEWIVVMTPKQWATLWKAAQVKT